MGTIYFHSPCFDGIVSATLTLDFLKNRLEWDRPKLCPIDYDEKGSWINRKLEEQSAVVDFLYHPDASFWADHHSTAFLAKELESEFHKKEGLYHIYNPHADSCAELLYCHFKESFDYSNSRFKELPEIAGVIDGARYSSPEEATFGTSPAMILNRTLALHENVPDYCIKLVELLQRESIDQIVKKDAVRTKAERVDGLTKDGLSRIEQSLKLNSSGIAVYEVSGQDVVVPRYGAYILAPNACYSVALVHYESFSKITAMRNPWIEFSNIHLGELFKTLGGGGHQRVASLILKNPEPTRARMTLNRIVELISSHSQAPITVHD